MPDVTLKPARYPFLSLATHSDVPSGLQNANTFAEHKGKPQSYLQGVLVTGEPSICTGGAFWWLEPCSPEAWAQQDSLCGGGVV